MLNLFVFNELRKYQELLACCFPRRICCDHKWPLDPTIFTYSDVCRLFSGVSIFFANHILATHSSVLAKLAQDTVCTQVSIDTAGSHKSALVWRIGKTVLAVTIQRVDSCWGWYIHHCHFRDGGGHLMKKSGNPCDGILLDGVESKCLHNLHQFV